MTPLIRRLVLPLLSLLLTTLGLSAEEPNRNVRFGLPSPAKADPKQREDYLIERPQYVLSYNAKTRTPNWVSWELRKEDIGRAARGPFSPDPLLPTGFAKVTSHVYDGSGFDRGHQCPAKDRSATQKDCDATFFLTNVVPQSPNSNQRGWERLEAYCRDLTKEGHVLYIVCGPHGVGGTGKNGKKEEIGKGRLDVTVPEKLWTCTARFEADSPDDTTTHGPSTSLSSWTGRCTPTRVAACSPGSMSKSRTGTLTRTRVAGRSWS